MPSRFRRTGALVGAGAALFGALAAAAGAQADARPDPIVPVLDQPTQGRAALSKVSTRLGEVAALNGIPAQQLQRTLATDRTSWLDRSGRLFFREPVVPAAARSEPAAPRVHSKPALAASGPAFQLHSKPGSNRVIFLDFDGHRITGTAWNASKGIDPINVSAYDTDGNPGVFSTAEQDVVRATWQRIAEDYAPFDVDVTTQAPPESSITRSGSSDQLYGTRVLVDPDTWYQSGCGCGGVAYVGVYDNTSNHSYYQPALVFTRGVGTGAKNIAEAASHEAGHNVGLGHDGTASTGYYRGHGAWAPIMGVGYSKAISQWSRGEYSGANNSQDDFAVIGQNGVAIRSDDYGNTTGTAFSINAGSTVTGYNADSADVDVFRVTLSAGSHTITANPAAVGANLDIKLDLLNSAGTVLATANPDSGQTSASTATGLGASITQNLSAGTYYVRVDNTGYGSPLNTGYSTYGSRGAFSLVVN